MGDGIDDSFLPCLRRVFQFLLKEQFNQVLALAKLCRDKLVSALDEGNQRAVHALAFDDIQLLTIAAFFALIAHEIDAAA